MSRPPGPPAAPTAASLPSPAPPALAPPPPPHDASRRLTGPGRDFPVPAVTLDPLGPATTDATALQGWARRVCAMAAALGWPDPQPRVRHAPDGRAEALGFAAPPLALLTATEVNEWAWERAADGAGGAELDAAVDAAVDAEDDGEAKAQAAADLRPLALQGFAPLQPVCDDVAAMARHFAARAALEHAPPLARLLGAAQVRGVPALWDDDSLTLGLGAGSRTWPRAALPPPFDVPWPALQRVPVVLVTGSNGKTTTTRVLAAIARAAGCHPGLCGTEGVWVDGRPLAGGDWAGPAGARAVLRHPAVDFAVLETARGGLLRRGLALAEADVAVVTHVSADHLGEYGLHGVEDIAEAKLAVARALVPGPGRLAGGALVLNGADTVLMRTADALPHARAPRRALFAADADHPALAAHRRAGGATCGTRDGRLWLHVPSNKDSDNVSTGTGTEAEAEAEAGTQAGAEAEAGADSDTGAVDLGAVREMPLTLDGLAPYNVENLAAAALAAHAAGLPVAAIRATLARFGAHPADNPGRLERHAHRGATVLLDYAHNPDGLARLLAVAQALRAPGRALRLLLGQAGNRDDDALQALAQAAAAAAPQQVVLKELPALWRGRAPGEVPERLRQALHAAGLPPAAVQRVDDETAAARTLLDAAAPGDVVVLPVHSNAARAALAGMLAGVLATRPHAPPGA